MPEEGSSSSSSGTGTGTSSGSSSSSGRTKMQGNERQVGHVECQ